MTPLLCLLAAAGAHVAAAKASPCMGKGNVNRTLRSHHRTPAGALTEGAALASAWPFGDASAAHVPYFASADNPLIFRGDIEIAAVDDVLTDMRAAGCLKTVEQGCEYARGCLKNVFARSSHVRTSTDEACGQLLSQGAELIGVNGISYVLQQLIADNDQAMNNFAHRTGELAFERAQTVGGGNLRWAAEALAFTNDYENHPLHGVTWAAVSAGRAPSDTWQHFDELTQWGLALADRHMFIDACHGAGHGQAFLMTGGYNASQVVAYSNLTAAAEVCASAASAYGAWGMPCASTCIDGIMHETYVAELTEGWLGAELAANENASIYLCAAVADVHPVRCYSRMSSTMTLTVAVCRDFVARTGGSIVQLAGCTSAAIESSASASTLFSDLSALSDLAGNLSAAALSEAGAVAPAEVQGAAAQAMATECAQFEDESYSLWVACTAALARGASGSINIGTWGYLPYYRPWVYSLAIQPGCAYGDEEALATVLCECEMMDMFADALLMGNRTWLEAMDVPLAEALADPHTPRHARALQARSEATAIYTARRDMLVGLTALPEQWGGGAYPTAWGYTREASDYWTSAPILSARA